MSVPNTFDTSVSDCLYNQDRPKVSLSDVLRNIPSIKRRTKESGCWPFDPEELIIKMLKGEMSLDDPFLQAIFLIG